MADSVGGYAALTLFDEDSEVLTGGRKINLLAPAVGARLEGIGDVLKSGRTLTICQLEVWGIQSDGGRRLVAHGRQTLVRARAKQ